ncbi:MAG: HD domain-containing protein [Coriobacteriia bacterium]|nr:HD domain-containing protein [Coriobacteriia bacterium]
MRSGSDDSATPFTCEIDPTWFIRPDGHDASRTIHGIGHTQRVWTHAMALADDLGVAAWQREALHYAALWHDIGRTHDGADYYHGAKSAGRVIGLELHLGIDDLVREVALFVVTHHCGSEEHAKLGAGWLPEPDDSWTVFKILKDSDALDRVRLGDLNPDLLRFQESRGRIPIAHEMLRESED